MVRRDFNAFPFHMVEVVGLKSQRRRRRIGSAAHIERVGCSLSREASFYYTEYSSICSRDGNGPGRPRAGPGLRIQARGPHGPKRA